MKVYVCFRRYLNEFLNEAQKNFEIILWSSSQADYSALLIDLVESTLNFKFDYVFTLADQTQSEEKDLYVKDIGILLGAGKRVVNDVLIVDTQMSNYTNKLTSGIFIPPYRLHNDSDDQVLKMLLKYLGGFIDQTNPIEDVRAKIKHDFGLLEKFNGYKQNQAFVKIKKTLEEAMASTQS